jgi:predicted DNA-binding transcriptional regulator YafY
MNSTAVIIDYTNHRGQRSMRIINPKTIVWKSSDWHSEPQWILDAWDYDKVADREFAMKDIHSWKPA